MNHYFSNASCDYMLQETLFCFFEFYATIEFQTLVHLWLNVPFSIFGNSWFCAQMLES
jgi:hypothetical protein